MMKMELSCGSFEFEIIGVSFNDEEMGLPEKQVLASIELKSPYITFSLYDFPFVAQEDYDNLVDALKDITDKPSFYRINLNSEIQILGVPGTLKDGEELDEFADLFSDTPQMDMNIAPAMVMIIRLPAKDENSQSTIQIEFNEDEIRQLTDYLEDFQGNMPEVIS